MSRAHFCNLFGFPWRARYFLWRAMGARTTVRLRFRGGGEISIRNRRTHDYGCAYEVFFQEPYRPSIAQQPRIIVDLGANVGYSILYFALKCRPAHIYAFEPHPIHAKLAAQLVAANHLEDIVTLMPVAAGTSDSHSSLTDRGTSSRLTAAPDSGAISVEVRDFFEWAKRTGPIDLLKIDIEGGEYALLTDPRLLDLNCRAILMEWHQMEGRSDGEQWCLNKLEQAGYRAEAIPEQSENRLSGGVIHARHI